MGYQVKSKVELIKQLQKLQEENTYIKRLLKEDPKANKTEEKIREAALYARNLIEASLDPLVTINSAGKITDVNVSTEQITGITRNKLIGTDFADYFTKPGFARTGYKIVF